MKEISFWGIACVAASLIMNYQIFQSVMDGKAIAVMPLMLIAMIPLLAGGLFFTLTGYCGGEK